MARKDEGFYQESVVAERYASSRPEYPVELFEFLAELAPSKSLAWDCATGNGQAARRLSENFEKVVATDHSAEQLRRATSGDRKNIEYRVAEAEQSGLELGTIDLVTVAQAVHWFDLSSFYEEVSRVLKSGGLIAVWCYRRPKVNSIIDRIVYKLWHEAERPDPIQLVEEEYASLRFPFEEVAVPSFTISVKWDCNRFVEYLSTWKWIAETRTAQSTPNENRLFQELASFWGAAERDVEWDLFIRAGRVAGPASLD